MNPQEAGAQNRLIITPGNRWEESLDRLKTKARNVANRIPGIIHQMKLNNLAQYRPSRARQINPNAWQIRISKRYRIYYEFMDEQNVLLYSVASTLKAH
jgi:mRNA-degrading endonuclease RelE of RelBE toxin-antitoxin system